ncbi:SDR family oxidoreductase [Algiphilus sp. W345]|uniref:SDR family oxidoreductase n=1 Tax=Banduia mediterranea TaxID=3075609 RepID=A0ABU2WF50_9GAMM|nr:SDR family oxidoreductase [Algiphilus sp. W345]MDT0496150.1 SDR family oxidoreductase [Algiphilus sp. W345]
MSIRTTEGGLQDSVALVTGATGYIGRAVAVRLARDGARVIVSGRNAQAGAAVVNEIEAQGGKACFEAADLYDPAQLHALAGRVAARFGRIDILVGSGAGASQDSLGFRLFKEMDEQHIERFIRAHWLTRLHAIRAVYPHMCAAGGGSMVMIGTDAGRVATVGEALIGGATAAMMQMCRVLAREFGRERIRMNAVSMSYISDAEPRWQDGSESLMGGDRHAGMLQNLRRRMHFDVRCQDIAEAVAFLASPAAQAITGQTLSVNGGLSTPG